MSANTATLEAVHGQYEDLPYPTRDPKDELTRLNCMLLDTLERLNHYCFGGRKVFGDGFRALVAGGGTGDTTIHLAEQLHGTAAEIVHLDISRASTEIAKERARVRGLTNIRWMEGSLLDVAGLGLGKFDYINCSGVLHHLADPDAGLKALADALTDDGAIGIMVYGKYGRTGVYQMQELMHYVTRGIEDRSEKIALARGALSSVPKTNWFGFNNALFVNEIRTPAGTYDLLLHAVDRPYTVPEIYDWVEGAGLEFVGFMHAPVSAKVLYNPMPWIKDEAVRAQVKKLSVREQQAMAELLHGSIERHAFYAARKRVAPPQPEEEFVPSFAAFFVQEQARDKLLEIVKNAPEPLITLTMPGWKVPLRFVKESHTYALIQAIDDRRTIGEILDKVAAEASPAPDRKTLHEQFRKLYAEFHLHDVLMLRHGSVPPGKNSAQLQQQMQARVGTPDAFTF